jgi:hypothetical protein
VGGVDDGTGAESDSADEEDEATDPESDAAGENDKRAESESDAAAPASLEAACAWTSAACKLRATARPMKNTKPQALGKPYLRHASEKLQVLTQLTNRTGAINSARKRI